MDSLNSTLSTSIFALVAVPFLIVALVFVVIILRTNRKAHATERWNTTSGRILVSQVTSYRSRSHGSTSTLYQPTIRYEYVVNGEHLQSEHVRVGMQYGTSWTQPAQNVVNKYPQGELVQVFYNPANPSEAVLEHNAGGSNRILTCVVALILGILLIAGASLFLMNGFMSQIMKLVPHF